MTALTIEEMMSAKIVPQKSSLPALPKREESISPSTPERKSPRSVLEYQLGLLLKLVEKVRSLDYVHIKNVPYLTRSQMLVNIPGPFSIRTPTSFSIEQKNGEAEDNDFGEDDAPDESELEAAEIQEEDVFKEEAHLNRSKFVVRNEFGHIRIQHLLEAIENSTYGMPVTTPPAHSSHHHWRSHSNSSPPSFSPNPGMQPHGLDIGGHCVLPKEVFDVCIEKGWGQPHVMAGRYHPIASTIIPETTLMFYAPRNEEELEIVWNIVYNSYEWALSDLKKKKNE